MKKEKEMLKYTFQYCEFKEERETPILKEVPRLIGDTWLTFCLTKEGKFYTIREKSTGLEVNTNSTLLPGLKIDRNSFEYHVDTFVKFIVEKNHVEKLMHKIKEGRK